MEGMIIPLAVFGMVVLIVALTSTTRMREREVEVHRVLQMAEMEHQEKMRQLGAELERVKHERDAAATHA